ncbi:MAG: hypothetical protein IJF37_04050 [Lachnospiraceae bacterium]|nr:hypothetical protein [Lachnospiraceae bacterium]
MALENDLRANLIKQFPAEVVKAKDTSGTEYFACPTCKRPVVVGKEKCGSCDQALNWDNIREEEKKLSGVKKATLTFEVSGDFGKSDCRKCPLSYIAKTGGENMYECPLNMRNNCPLEFS